MTDAEEIADRYKRLADAQLLAGRIERWPTFTAEYRHDGAAWSFEFPAKDQADAQRRLRSIQGNADLKGEIVARIRAVPGVGSWVRLRCWAENLKRHFHIKILGRKL